MSTDREPILARSSDATLSAVVLGFCAVGLALFASSFVLIVLGVSGIALTVRDLQQRADRPPRLTRVVWALALGGAVAAVLTPLLWFVLAARTVGAEGGFDWVSVLVYTEFGWSSYTPLNEVSALTYAPLHLSSWVPAVLWLAAAVVAYAGPARRPSR